MLELRPNCECCDVDLPPDAPAFICTFECTFCETCTDEVFKGICPNCGGDLQKRPIRPIRHLIKNPASRDRIFKKHV